MVSGNLWTPEGVSHDAIAAVSPPEMRGELGNRPQANIYKFTFKYKGKQKEIWITADADATHSEIEDLAGKEVETWIDSLNQEEHLPAPTAQQKKEIGKVLNEIRTHGIKRRLSSNNRIYFPGVK